MKLNQWAIVIPMGLSSFIFGAIAIFAHPAMAENLSEQSPESAEAQLWHLLRERNTYPERRQDIDLQIQTLFAQTQAVLVMDMVGFSQTTQDQGIIETLAQIEHMRSLTTPLIEAHQGTVVKLEADNVYALFPTPDQAVTAAIAIVEQLNQVNLHASIGIGYGELLVLESDVFGDPINLASKLGEDIAGDDVILLTESAVNALTERVAVDPFEITISGLDLQVYQVATEPSCLNLLRQRFE
jgi:adenylate cyclase